MDKGNTQLGARIFSNHQSLFPKKNMTNYPRSLISSGWGLVGEWYSMCGTKYLLLGLLSRLWDNSRPQWAGVHWLKSLWAWPTAMTCSRMTSRSTVNPVFFQTGELGFGNEAPTRENRVLGLKQLLLTKSYKVLSETLANWKILRCAE